VIAAATVRPAGIINRMPKLGTSQVGALADISTLELVDGPVETVRHLQQVAHRQGFCGLCRPFAAAPFGGPYSLPFSASYSRHCWNVRNTASPIRKLTSASRGRMHSNAEL
jgi:dihydroorotase